MIRRGVEGDRSRVLAMAKAFHAACGLSFPFSAPMADALFRASLVEADRVCLVFAPAGEARGVLAAHAGMHQFAPVKVASEIMWWVDPEYRGGSSVRMLAAYEEWARERGCVYAAVAGLGADPLVGRLYE